MATTHGSGSISIYWNELNGVVLALDEQPVRWYWCTNGRIFEFEDIFAWCRMHFEIAIAHAYATLYSNSPQWMTTTHDSELILILVK